MHHIAVHPEHELVVGTFEGKVTLDEHMVLKQKLMVDDRAREHFRGVLDYRRADLSMSVSEVKQLADYAMELQSSSGRWALLLDSPEQVALAMIYLGKVEGEQEERMFSSVESASKYLDIDLTPFLQSVSPA